MIGEALQQVEEIEREAVRARFEYRTLWVADDPEEKINRLAQDGWRLHSVVVDGQVREGMIHEGCTNFMVVMEREGER